MNNFLSISLPTVLADLEGQGRGGGFRQSADPQNPTVNSLLGKIGLSLIVCLKQIGIYFEKTVRQGRVGKVLWVYTNRWSDQRTTGGEILKLNFFFFLLINFSTYCNQLAKVASRPTVFLTLDPPLVLIILFYFYHKSNKYNSQIIFNFLFFYLLSYRQIICDVYAQHIMRI